MLVVDGQELDRLLFAHLVRRTKLKVTAVLDLAQAERSVCNVRFDLVVLDRGPPGGARTGLTGPSLDCGGPGYAGPIVATGADLTPWIDRLRAAGVEATIPKPYDEDRLLVVLHAALTMGAGPDADPLYSDLAAQDGIEPLLAAFCKRVQQVLGDLHKLTAAGNVSEVRHACVGLRGSAGGYGFRVDHRRGRRRRQGAGRQRRRRRGPRGAQPPDGPVPPGLGPAAARLGPPTADNAQFRRRFRGTAGPV